MRTLAESRLNEAPVRTVVSTARRSVLVAVAAVGLVLILFAVGIEAAIRAGFLVRGLSGTIAVIVLLWGTGLLVLGTVGRAFVWLRRR